MRAALLLLVGACKFSHGVGDDVGPAEGGIGNDVRTPDAELPTGPFGNVTQLTTLGSAGSEDDATLTGDMLEIYFDRDGDVYVSTRSSVTDGWPTPKPLTVANTSSTETTPEITADGLQLFFSSTRASGSDYDIYVLTRASRSASFGTPTAVNELASSSDDVTPTPATPLVMYFASTRGSGLDIDLYRADRSSPTGTWSSPIAVASTAGTETEPWANPEETVLYISGDGAGGRDLYLLTRGSASEAWGLPSAVSELNSIGQEQDPWLSPDGHTMIFASDRGGDFELYQATR